jgi:hypothetical protein
MTGSPGTTETGHIVSTADESGVQDHPQLSQWAYGDVAASLGSLRARPAKGERRLQQFARLAGVPYQTMLAWRHVALCYPPEHRRADVSWSVFQVLASQPDRLELVSVGAWSVSAARELVRRRSAGQVTSAAA